MDKVKFVFSVLTIVVLLATSARGLAQQITIESIQVVRILDQEEKAMIKLPDGKMHILKVGDDLTKDPLRVTGSGLRVVEITEGRIVIEEKTERGLEKVIITVENGKQRIERIRKIGEGQPGLYSPVQRDKAK
jgi:hypothetical protein